MVDSGTNDSETVAGRYVFDVRFHVTPAVEGVSVEPNWFETTLYWRAETPGVEGWRFFRDNLWHGEVNDPEHLRAEAGDILGVPVDEVSFRELQMTPEYRQRLEDEVAANLDDFRADTVEGALSKYLGSAVRLVEKPEWAAD